MRAYHVALLLVLLTACGGGGGGGNPAPPGPALLAASRYFPSPLGAHFTYRLVLLNSGSLPIFGLAGTELSYVVQQNPIGPGVYYNLQDTADSSSGPTFDGLIYTGCLEENTGISLPETTLLDAARPELLPAALTGIGQEWPVDFRTQRVGNKAFHIVGTAKLGGLNDVQLGPTLLRNCLRVDVQFGYSFFSDLGAATSDIPIITGSYWLAPDIGPVLGSMHVAGLEVGRVALVTSDLL